MIRYNPRGLSPNEVAESRRQHGDNVITPPKDDSVWKLLADKFRDPIIRILLLAAVLSLAIGFVHKDFTESIGIICAIILATCVGFWFEWDAMRRFRRLNQVNDDIPVKVMRDGAMHEVPRRDVVVGDVVYIESGETVPVDGELVEAVSLRINESTLTGELEVDKTVDEAHFDPDATYPSNVVLRGTTVADGYGVMVSTAVGDATEAGRVTEQATVQSEEQTPLNRQLTRLSKLIGRAGIVLSIAIFCVMLGKAIFINGLLEGDWLAISQHVLHIFMVSVAIIVMAVPEGLPMSITLSLAMSMRRMLKTNNLVRRMHACETMGAVTVICTDKTGTLTQNRMHVQELVRYDALPMHDFAEIVAANSTAFLDVTGAVIGNPTEGALLEWLHAQGEDYEPLRAGAKIVDRLTFSTERKYMATIIQSGISGRRIVCVKGAPEIVRAMCAPDGKDEQVAEQLLGFQGRAMRTLAVAWAETAEDEELLGRVQELKIMSRARPLDKQRLVRLLQQCGEVVAVTGDGTNDAPALNFANVGLSMGSGTSVAKDASDITLLDDSFASIATAVMWGRSLYRNIQRFVLFQLTINFAAILICFVGAVFGTDMPLTVVQILWVNIIMDTFAAMAMASLPPNPEVMLEKPRPRNE
ncbi:HAD-IC family P-type ATPase, partial [Alistipes sp.]|uniref:HAD-IC family P-type ATPase n=1 Tax=Alistipes sp. TaxID=1872444 RepID=UPI0023F2AC4A